MGSLNSKHGASLLRALCQEGAASPRNPRAGKSTQLSSRPSSNAPTLEDLPSSSQLPLSCFSLTVITYCPVLVVRPSTTRAGMQASVTYG